MKLKLEEIISKTAVLTSVARKKLPVKIGYAVSRNYEKLAKEQSIFEEQRQRICRELSDKDEKGDPVMMKSVIDGMPVESYKLSDEALAQLQADLREILSTEIDIDVLTVNMDALERIDEDPRYEALSPGEIGALEFMITEG